MKLRNLIATQIIFLGISIGCYIGNVVRFVTCDFEPSYKAEVLYGMGLITPMFYVTAFMDLEKKE